MPATSAPTLGVEEELHVATAGSGRLVSRGPEVLGRAAPDGRDGGAVAELTMSQRETVTFVASGVEDVVPRAARLRAAVARGAHELGLELHASGTPVLGDPDEQHVAPDRKSTRLNSSH